ncbi:MAG: 3D domain-containing protein [Candidatus Magasanikbacteria bacterium]|nr:3D domain-containing protein [Candidatus Magasanikbacteria bacterium]
MRVTLPVAPDRAPRKAVTVVATAYNSVPWQTDDTPFITASGTRTRHGVVAANFLPIGAHVRFPDVYGDTIFVVEDRMNKKYYRGRVDIWMEEVPDARIFGAKRLTMEVF